MRLLEILTDLTKIELSELELSNIGAWPAAVRVLLSGLIVIALLTLGYFLRLTDLQVQLERARAEEVLLKQEFTLTAGQAAQFKDYKKHLELMETAFASLLGQLPSNAEVPSLLENISSAGLGSGLEFEQITLLPEIEQPFYRELPIQLKVVGHYHDLAMFLSALAQLPRIITTHDFSIKPTQTETSAQLLMEILVKTYRYHEQGAQP